MREQKKALEHQISDLFALKAKHGPNSGPSVRFSSPNQQCTPAEMRRIGSLAENRPLLQLPRLRVRRHHSREHGSCPHRLPGRRARCGHFRALCDVDHKEGHCITSVAHTSLMLQRRAVGPVDSSAPEVRRKIVAFSKKNASRAVPPSCTIPSGSATPPLAYADLDRLRRTLERQSSRNVDLVRGVSRYSPSPILRKVLPD